MKLGITSIQRDRGKWLSEWIAFHYLVGFRKFFIYLHNCSDNSEEVLKKLKNKIDITLISDFPDETNPQLELYNFSYSKYGNGVEWMAFIDSDEFLFPTHEDTIEVPLQNFSGKKVSAIGVYWSCFGGSNFVKEPEGLIIENYKYKALDGYPNNRHIKSIVKGGQSGILARNPHLFKTPMGTFDENLRPITKGWTDYEPTYNNLRINHYVTQSREYFEKFKSKISTPDGSPPRNEQYWKEHDRNDLIDNSIERFIVPLKKLLKNL